MRYATVLEENRDELGEVLSIHRAGVTVRLLLTVYGPLVLALLLAWLLPWFGRTEVLIFAVVCAVLLTAVAVMSAREGLVVCERGLLLGGMSRPRAPLLLVRYDQIVPGSLVPVTGAQRYTALTRPAGKSETLRILLGTRTGIHFVGPDPDVARRPRSARPPFLSSPVRSIDGRPIWFATTGRTSPADVTAEIAQAARRLGLHALADAAEAAPTRELTKDPADRHRLLPGYPMHSIEPMHPAGPTTTHRSPGPYPPTH